MKKFSQTKFDSSVEVHFRLGIDPSKGDQQIRAAVNLPHGSGKTVRVAAFVPENKIAEVKHRFLFSLSALVESDKGALHL